MYPAVLKIIKSERKIHFHRVHILLLNKSQIIVIPYYCTLGPCILKNFLDSSRSLSCIQPRGCLLFMPRSSRRPPPASFLVAVPTIYPRRPLFSLLLSSRSLSLSLALLSTRRNAIGAKRCDARASARVEPPARVLARIYI